MPMFENVAPALRRALDKRGYETLTPVQSSVLAENIQSADLVVSAQTGSGKTVAFGLALANSLLAGEDRFGKAGAPLALIIAPTRELALQVTRELEWLFAEAGASLASCVGGMDARDERRALNFGAHIVVGTPGRLADHIRRGALELHALQAVVLDEADEMLNLGFREELEFILEGSPVERRTLMFSATMPRAMEALARKYQRDAVRVNTVSEQKQHMDIEYRALVVAGHESENAIFNVLRFFDATNALVFCNTRMAVNRVMSRLSDRGFSVVALSGELSQNERNHALQALRDRRAQVCVATDVAARGIDLPDLELVIHAELPKNPESLLHRSGRTGRAGRKGTSVLIVPHSARKRTERLLWDAKIEARWGNPPSADDVKRKDDKRLLADPILSQAPQESDLNIVQELLSGHSAEAIASAFVRLYRKGQAAPEDLAPVADRPDRRERTERRDRPERDRPERAERPRYDPSAERAPREGPRESHRQSRDSSDDEGGVWISLSVGRSKSAEPRWLIPMLCKAGGITKRDIGTIRIHQNETHIKIFSANADKFFAAIGDGKLEKSVYVSKLEDGPQFVEEAPQTERPQTPPKGDYAKRPKFKGREATGAVLRVKEGAKRKGDGSGKPRPKPYKGKTTTGAPTLKKKKGNPER